MQKEISYATMTPGQIPKIKAITEQHRISMAVMPKAWISSLAIG